MPHKAGFVNIIGYPNVGKSTLMNALIGEDLSAITAKAQTTRHRILGIMNGDDYQVVFSDTPGILTPRYGLQEAMMQQMEPVFQDADIFLLVTESGVPFEDQELLDKISKSGIFTLVLINKIDLSDQTRVEEIMKEWKERMPNAEVLPLSALHEFNLEAIRQLILEHLPEAPPYYDKEDISDRSERFFVSEKIRGCILELYQREVPYSVEVVTESFVMENNILKIRAVIYVERETQKVIIIGHGGRAIRKLGIESRILLEEFFQEHIFLELFVKVSKDWRDDKRMLRKFGYLP